MAQTHLFSPLAGTPLIPLWFPFTYLESLSLCGAILSTLAPGCSWTDLPFHNPPQSLPIPNSRLPGFPQQAMRLTKTTSRSRLPRSGTVNPCVYCRCAGFSNKNLFALKGRKICKWYLFSLRFAGFFVKKKTSFSLFFLHFAIKFLLRLGAKIQRSYSAYFRCLSLPIFRFHLNDIFSWSMFIFMCMSMSISLYVHVNAAYHTHSVHAACPCPSCISISKLHFDVHAACPCCISKLQVHAACPFFMSLLYHFSMLGVHASCPCCMPMLRELATKIYCVNVLCEMLHEHEHEHEKECKSENESKFWKYT